ncbi:hypothetical protein DVS28_b0611 (plasmid) [Euzebya pacifica]|uniref:Uncharacterized protein n=1 Tax=Euzebya pacifica TaxID=1608957 RepID=A0A346Y7A4_9ACTN|nr:hypothetical protein [Euzebya pacifica]AXV10351.1 hypothetical protein DVS28_b0611 [Euzebya pacifica]
MNEPDPILEMAGRYGIGPVGVRRAGELGVVVAVALVVLAAGRYVNAFAFGWVVPLVAGLGFGVVGAAAATVERTDDVRVGVGIGVPFLLAGLVFALV